MKTKKIIIATYGFPPYLKSLGGSIRILKLADYLISRGHDVTVVCAQTPHLDSFGYDNLLSKIKTIPCEDPVASLAKRIRVARTTAGSSGSGAKERLKHRLKTIVLDAMVPDTGVLVVRSMLEVVRREVDSADEPVTLITSGPPHSVHLVGSKLKRTHPRVNWIMDYRDSWNGTSLFRKRTPLLQRLNASFERKCIRAADHLSYISSPMLPKAERIAGISLTSKATLISNGYDEALLQEVWQEPPHRRDDTGPLRIGYYGALDHGPSSYRDPAIIFRALLKLPESAIQFIVHGPSVLEAGWAERLGFRLKDGGKLPHTDAIRSMFKMDALLLLHTREEGADEVVTGKVFEYIATGLPIISIGPANMAVNALLKQDPSFHWVDHRDEVGLVTLLQQLANGRTVQVRRPDDLIHSFSRTAQHEKFLKLISS
ncbi:glycosyltransferase [Roseateles sp.]|uniref:glycosyltransferase n=1 Tax=Roseateles sp. TaxID=1971397 RepID=UPI002E04AB09|nr:glycosyltransferase [Roseateles sp.]